MSVSMQERSVSIHRNGTRICFNSTGTGFQDAGWYLKIPHLRMHQDKYVLNVAHAGVRFLPQWVKHEISFGFLYASVA